MTYWADFLENAKARSGQARVKVEEVFHGAKDATASTVQSYVDNVMQITVKLNMHSISSVLTNPTGFREK